MLAFGLALVAHRVRGCSTSRSASSAALVYTIPSLAIFQILIPFFGLSTTTIEIPLVGYSLVILYPNIVAGPPRRAAGGARGGARDGPESRQVLTRVELPLAVPAIIGGLRIAVVSTVSIATIAAFLGGRGLGAPIFTALKQPTPFKTEIYAAGILVVALALAVRPPARGSCAACSCPGRGRRAHEPRRHRLRRRERAHLPATRSASSPTIPASWRRRRSSSSSSPARRSGSRSLVALPAGIVLGHLHRGSAVAIGSSIVGRALPSLVLIGVLLTVLGIGFVNNMTALAVLATGPILTNAYEGVDGVDRDVVEAARGMGMSSLPDPRPGRAAARACR